MATKTTAKRYPERLGVYFTPEDVSALRVLAIRSKRSTSDLVRLAVDALLRNPDVFLRPDYGKIMDAVSRQSEQEHVA